VPQCALQQQAQYGGSNARCGEVVITAGNGKKSVDTVTVTIGGKAPTILAAGQTIQSAIDASDPGDLIIVPPGSYHELLLMWKPVRLQGVGAASSIVDANAHPAGILNDWRLRWFACSDSRPRARRTGMTRPAEVAGPISSRQAPIRKWIACRSRRLSAGMPR